eukprot:m.16698 g.16698  ORF g.16698 m.16698 type:complete len:219 (-) comp11162_c0_seq2:40-696(-)
MIVMFWSGGMQPAAVILMLLLNTPLLGYCLDLLPLILTAIAFVGIVAYKFPNQIRAFAQRLHIEHHYNDLVNVLRTPFWRGNFTQWEWEWPNSSSASRVRVATETMDSYPTEIYLPPTLRKDQSVRELKIVLKNRGVEIDRGALEKEDLLRYFDGETTTCSICIDEYETGDVLRVLRCKHLFHRECIDKWGKAACDLARPVACPLCNTPISSNLHGNV